MRPTSPELLEVLDQTFVRHVVPEVTEPYVKARVAVMSQITGHLHQRALHEGEALWQDTRELVELLRAVAADAPDVDVEAALARAEAAVPAGAYPSVARLTERAVVLKGCLVDVLAAVALGSPADAQINAYLRRQLDRELLVCSAPALAGEAAHDLPLV